MGEYNKVESLVHLHIHYATVYWVVIEYQLIEERERSRMKVNNVTFLIFFSRCISSILYHQSLTTAILVSEIFYFCLLQIRALCINVVSNCPHGVMKNTHIKWSVPWFFFFFMITNNSTIIVVYLDWRILTQFSACMVSYSLHQYTWHCNNYAFSSYPSNLEVPFGS